MTSHDTLLSREIEQDRATQLARRLTLKHTEAIAKVSGGLQQLGWSDGRNMCLDIRWTGGNADAVRRHVAELATLAPDVIPVTGSATVGPLLQVTRAVPTVFVYVPDPVGAGFVDTDRTRYKAA